VNLNGAGALPRDWIPDADIRLGLYVRLARTTEEAELDAFEEELADRFGPLPPEAQDLVIAARIAILAHGAAVARIDAGPAAIALTPHGDSLAVPEGSGLIEKEGRWLLKERTENEERGARVLELLETLAASEA
jgi:transcription-repair coupling factor (superfamily II helicase)